MFINQPIILTSSIIGTKAIITSLIPSMAVILIAIYFSPFQAFLTYDINQPIKAISKKTGTKATIKSFIELIPVTFIAIPIKQLSSSLINLLVNQTIP